jgi:hypothetical protein
MLEFFKVVLVAFDYHDDPKCYLDYGPTTHVIGKKDII